MSADARNQYERDSFEQMALAERAQRMLEHKRISKRKVDEEEAFRRDCPAYVAALEYARNNTDVFFAVPTPDEIDAADPEARELERKLAVVGSAVAAVKSVGAVAQAALDAVRLADCRFFKAVYPRILAATEKASLMAYQRLLVDATQMTDTVLPHFIASSCHRAESICGCRITYCDAHAYDHYGDDGEILRADAPAACYHKLCNYHRNVTPVAADELCRLFCAAMDAAGDSIPAHSVHAFTKQEGALSS